MHSQIAFAVVFSFGLGIAEAEKPERADDLAAPVRITAGGVAIEIGGFAAPAWGDLNGDGRPDLIVGQLDPGSVTAFLNEGTAAEPRFGRRHPIMADGSPAAVPSGCSVGFTPQWVDFDDDGHPDLLTGSFPGAAVFVFSGRGDGTFDAATVQVTSDGNPKLGSSIYNSTAWATDWDLDGDLDLLVGRSKPRLVLNHGTNRRPRFSPADSLTIQGNDLPRGRVPPIVADWDHDGRPDLLAGEGDNVVWYRNESDAGSPRFAAAQTLFVSADLNKSSPLAAPSRDAAEEQNGAAQPPQRTAYAICAADYDADGDLDLLVGDTTFRRRERTPAEVEACRVASRRRSDFIRRYRDLFDGDWLGGREEQVEAFRSALQEWGEIENRRFEGEPLARPSIARDGTVWLFRRTESP